ncbi:hypothetical protein NGA_0468300, partial [Nannochloropsis gaditana CCMP526]|uniref:uncharacterized protein n=1 Tax=Nannochloropsis gaditana (strain CCMP526) TaxID=1093141 RepID=UPI00029F5D26
SSNSSNSSSGSGSSFSSHASTVSVWRRQQQQQPRQQQQQQQRVTPSPESGLGAVDRTVGGGEADTTTAPTAIKTQHSSDGGQETEAEEAPFLANGSTSTAKKKRTPRGPPFQVQHQEPLLLPHLDTTQGAAGAAFQQEMGKLSKYIDPDRHVERGPYHGKSYPDSLTYEPEDSEVWRTHEVGR